MGRSGREAVKAGGPPLFRRAARAAFACAWLACAGLFPGCLGGSDDVENPSALPDPSVSVSLLDAAGNPAAGTLSLYARYQNPFKDSVPLLSLPVSGGPAKVEDTLVAAAFARARARGTPSPSADTLEFNLLASSPGGEAFLGGYALVHRPAGWDFIRRADGGVLYPDERRILRTEARMPAPILGQRGRIGPRGLELGLKNVFVPGSPYKAALDADGSFTLARIAAGRYGLKAISSDEKVYAAADSLEAGAAYDGSEWSEAEVIWVAP
jgi:hypothetical protein